LTKRLFCISFVLLARKFKIGNKPLCTFLSRVVFRKVFMHIL
jgi:hypothetical protein